MDTNKNAIINIESQEYISFVRSMEAFVEKHKSCGEKCRHLEKFYESLGLTRSSSKNKKSRMVCSSAYALPKIDSKNSLQSDSFV